MKSLLKSLHALLAALQYFAHITIYNPLIMLEGKTYILIVKKGGKTLNKKSKRGEKYGLPIDADAYICSIHSP